MTSFRIGLLAFPAMTQLDMTGPLQVFAMEVASAKGLVLEEHARTRPGLSTTALTERPLPPVSVMVPIELVLP